MYIVEEGGKLRDSNLPTTVKERLDEEPVRTKTVLFVVSVRLRFLQEGVLKT